MEVLRYIIIIILFFERFHKVLFTFHSQCRKDMNTNKLTFGALAAVAVALAVAMLVSTVAIPVSAALECRTSSGNTPPGQNDDKPLKEDCKGNKDITTSKGKIVPGQNK